VRPKPLSFEGTDVYRLFIDEVGHDNLKASSSSLEQHLCLMGVILNGRGHRDLTERMNTLKTTTLGTNKAVLHRREIIEKKPAPFDRLRDETIRASFDAGMLGIIRDSSYTALTVLIDKHDQLKKYKVYYLNPYHYCLTTMMERYVMWLKDHQVTGDVVAEWRSPDQNKRLEAAYAYFYKHGTKNVTKAEVQACLTSSQLKIEKKEANISGLQLADLVAHPARTYLICKKRGERMTAPFGREIVKILLKTKYRKNEKGVITGYGIKYLP
jgi:Protein of unknown function (DUF3800)